MNLRAPSVTRSLPLLLLALGLAFGLAAPVGEAKAPKSARYRVSAAFHGTSEYTFHHAPCRPHEICWEGPRKSYYEAAWSLETGRPTRVRRRGTVIEFDAPATGEVESYVLSSRHPPHSFPYAGGTLRCDEASVDEFVLSGFPVTGSISADPGTGASGPVFGIDYTEAKPVEVHHSGRTCTHTPTGEVMDGEPQEVLYGTCCSAPPYSHVPSGLLQIGGLERTVGPLDAQTLVFPEELPLQIPKEVFGKRTSTTIEFGYSDTYALGQNSADVEWDYVWRINFRPV